MQPGRFSNLQQAEIHLVRGINSEGIDFFAYVAAYPERAKALKVALRSGKQPDMEQYGIVLYLGRGEPDERLGQYILNCFSQV